MITTMTSHEHDFVTKRTNEVPDLKDEAELESNSHDGDAKWAERDHRDLTRVGKRPVLLRNFGFMSILGFSCTSLVTWECALLVFDVGLADGGPSTIVYGFILAWFGAACIYASLAELASMAPTSGGQYHWVSMLSPPSCRNYLSYITGWLTVIGWQANLAGGFYISSKMTLSLARLNNINVPNENWQLVLLYWAIICYSLFVNAVISKFLPAFESFILVLHIIGWPAILIPLVYFGDHVPAPAVFQNFTNEGNLYTEGLAVIIGLSGNVLCLLGADAAIHMSEEIRNAASIVPKSVMSGVAINGSLGFGMLVAVLFTQGDLDKAEKSPTDYAFMDIFLQATGSLGGATTMIAIILIMQYSCGVGLMAATSRMTWSFARDHGLPGWKYFARVNQRTKIPLASVLLTAFISVLFSLIIFGSTTAFNNIISISIIGLFASYFMAAGLLLYHRVAGHISNSKQYEDDVVNTTGAQLVWGPWRMPDWLGIPVNTYACAWALFEAFFNLFPTELPVTPQNMQYSVVVTGGVVVLATIWYILGGRKQWTGPIIEVRRGST